MSNLGTVDRWALAAWVVSTWTEDELREHAVMTIVGMHNNVPGQFEEHLEQMNLDKEGEA